MLERAVEEIKHHLQVGEVPRLVGTSGTIRNFDDYPCLVEIGINS
jgi:exopolyphosphatase/guanosine-5'-triphosphate,3'-diphosphate pyrophosphatase